jgi:NifU-like protein involved in Fe-S cluster formation
LTGRLEHPQATVRKRSPLCGSTVTVDVILRDGRIAEFGQDVKACALGQAAAAVLGTAVIGRTRAEIDTGREQLHAMLKSGGPVPDAPFEGLEALKPAADFKNRHASILLAFDATAAAMQDAGATA